MAEQGRGRGRPPKDEATRKSEPLSIRLTPELRARLDEERMSDDPARTLSKEIELRIEESFDFDKAVEQQLGGSDLYYCLLRLVAQQINIIEHQTGRRFVENRFTFDQVKAAINTILDHFKPPGASSPPEFLTGLLDERAITLLGKRAALLALAQLEIAEMSAERKIVLRSIPVKREEDSRKNSGDLLVLPDFVNPIAASRRLSQWMQKSALQNWSKIGAERRRPPLKSQQRNPGESPNDRSRSQARCSNVGAQV